MGGHEGGRVASTTAIQVLKSLFESSLPEAGQARYLRQIIETAGRAVHALASGEESELRPGSTCVALLFTRTGAAVAHVGDSRAYRLRGGVIERLTNDHSLINDLVMAGIMSPTDARNHPDAHRITRALGMNAQVVVDVRELHDLRTGDEFLLCSDGLTDLVDDDEIARILGGTQHDNLARACVALVELAKQRGGHDNVTAVAAYVVTPGANQTEGTDPLPTETDATNVMPATVPAALHPTVALSEPKEPRIAPTVVESPPLRSSGATETVPLPIAQQTQVDTPRAPITQPGQAIKWDTAQSDYAPTPRSGARFIVMAAAICGLVILGLLLWAIVH
jgi:protein phosphatase